MKDVSWLAIGKAVVVGPSERPEYEAAFAAAGFEMAEPEDASEYGAGAIRFVRKA